MAERKITITFLGDSKGAVQAIGDVSNKVGGLGGVIGDVAKTAAGFALGQGLTALPGALLGLNDQAKNLELQAKKAATVFGDSFQDVQDWAKESAGGLGLTTREATNLAAGLGDLLIPMGFTRDAAADMASKTIGLAGALSEWSGGAKSSAEVSDILTKAYLGETDGLKALGIAISANDVTARLAAKGQEKLEGAALSQAKALAIQELVFEKSTDAQDAFAKGADGNARKQAAASAKIRELKENIALGLQPAFIAVTGLIADKLIPTVTNLANQAIPYVQAAAEKVGPAIAKIGEIIQTQVLPPLQAAADWFTGNGDAMAAAGGAIAAILVAAFVSWAIAAGAAAVATIAAAAPVIALGLVLAALGAGIVLLVQHWDDLTAKYPQLQAASDAVKAALATFVGWIKSDFVPTVQAIADKVQEVSDDVVRIATEVWGKVGPAIEVQLNIVKTIVATYFGLVKTTIETALGVIKGIVDVFMGVFTGDWDRAWSGVKQIVSSIWEGIKQSISTVITGIQNLAPDIKKAGAALGDALLEGLKGALSATAGFAGDVGAAVIQAVKALVNSQVIDRINSALAFSFDTHIPGVGTIHIDPADIPHLALGGLASGMVRVGEFGPETLVLPRGSRILADGGRGGAGGINFNGPVIIHAEDRNRALLAAGDFAYGIRGRMLRTGGL